MRFPTTVSITAAAAVLLSRIPLVNAGWPSGMSEKDKKEIENMVAGLQNIPVDLKLFVKCKQERKKKCQRIVSKCAKNGVFEQHLNRKQVLTFTCKSSLCLKKLGKSPHIEYVERIHQVHALPLRHQTGRQNRNRRTEESTPYGIDMVQASPNLWQGKKPLSNMTICILDSGYGLGHPDLPNLTDGVNGSTTGTGDWAKDEYGHGTHCAGVIGAIGKNNQGIVGVLSDPSSFRFHIGKVLDGSGYGSESDLLDAFEGCVESGADVISMSLGSREYGETIRDACKEAYDEGILIVAAAGNEGLTDYTYPASHPYVMSVAAVDKDGKVASFSQYNDQVEIAGPGVDIDSTVTTNWGNDFDYDSWSGTSMATPYVAGVAALVWSYFPQCSNAQIRNVLIRTAKKEDGPGCSDEYGFGVVQAKDAYELLQKDGCLAGDASPTPLSDGAVGGCFQDPLYTESPTAAPTNFDCAGRVFLLELTTDEWAEETSWDVRNSKNAVVGSGDAYKKSSTYSEWLCLSNNTLYTFTIRDSENDGICCEFGEGSYAVYFDGKIVKKGGKFKESDSVAFGEQKVKTIEDPASPPSPAGKTPKNCEDDNKWFYETPKGIKKTCKHVQLKPSARCDQSGVDEFGHPSSAKDSCPLTCGKCSPVGQPPSQPDITESPSFQPTVHPTTSPSRLPTKLPTFQPTVYPTKQPSRLPTMLPSSYPTVYPTRQPSPSPTEHPTSQPTVYPTRQPSPSPTEHPTSQPTVYPTERPSPSPTEHPTSRPTNTPSLSPTNLPTPPPTVHPTRKPSPSPTKIPTSQPLSNPIQNKQQTAGYAASSVCTDDLTWSGFDDAETTCNYVAEVKREKYAKCASMGFVNNETSVGFKSCPVKCDMCQVGEKAPCEDDENWLELRGKDDCKKMRKDPEKNCIEQGIDGKGEITFAYQSCRESCGTCASKICQDDSSWRIDKFGDLKSNEKKIKKIDHYNNQDKDDWFTCNDIKEDISDACQMTGITNGAATIAFRSCPKSCSTCDDSVLAECSDDETWESFGRDSCRELEKHLERCRETGTSKNGKISIGFQACPMTCGSCSRFAAPSVAKQDDDPATSLDICRDDPNWLVHGKDSCAKVATDIDKTVQSKCDDVGLVNGTVTNAFKGCPVSCNLCKPGEEIVEECTDDAHWRFVDKKHEYSCKFFEERPEKCKEVGIDGNGQVSSGYQACRKSCDRCPPIGVCQDNPNWTSNKGKPCEEVIKFHEIYRDCEDVGIVDGTTTTAFQSCRRSCRTCGPPGTAQAACKDDETWYHIDKNGQTLTCEWMEEKRDKNCKEVGFYSNGVAALGFQACQRSCGSCLPM